MTLYCDSSTLLKLYVHEPDSEAVQRSIQTAAVIATSAIAFVELRSALARTYRERRVTRTGLDVALGLLSDDWDGFLVVSSDQRLLRLAGDLSQLHALRALDAIHLASFQQVLERTDDDVEFSTFDERLARAAKKLR